MVKRNQIHFPLSKICLLIFLLPSIIFSQENMDNMLDSLLAYSAPIIKVEAIDSQENFIFLDAREIIEYETSHIPKAIFVGFENFKSQIVTEKISNKNQAIIVYCSVGYRSEIIANKLIEQGYTNVQNLYGGIFDWKNKENLVVDQQEITTDKIHTYSKEWSKWLTNGIKIY